MMLTVMSLTPMCRGFEQAVALFEEYRSHYGQPSSPEVAGGWLSEQLTQGRLFLTVASDGEDQLCGFVTVMVMPASLMLGVAWSIRDLYVTARFRRAGVARQLLQHVAAGAREAGALRLSLQTETDNAPARALYAAAGFQRVNGLELLNLPLGSEAA